MFNTASWGTIALAMAIGCAGASAQTPIPPSPKDFVLAALQSGQYEILAANLAAVQGQDRRVKAFAEEMIQDHTRLSDGLRKAATASGLPPPAPSMSSDQASWLAGLQAVRGADFDRTYARQQELAHAQAIAVDESFAAAGADPNVKQTAQSALPTLREHLKMAHQLSVDVGGSAAER